MPGYAAVTPVLRHHDIGKKAAAVLWRVGLVLFCMVASAATAGSRIGYEEEMGIPERLALNYFATILVFVLPLLVLARHRHPVAVTVGSSLCSLLAHLDPTVGLIAFTTTVRRARSPFAPVPWATGALLGVATTVALHRDAVRVSSKHAVLGNLLYASKEGADSGVPPIPLVVVSTMMMTLPIVVGLWLRARDGEVAARRRAQEAAAASARAERVAHEQTLASNRLADTVSLQAERERVAREVHDGLGHRLSLLALHAAALEQGLLDGSDGSKAPDDVADDTRDTARHMREEAQGAMRDLRSLLAVLREPVTAAEPAPRLEDLKEVVDGVLAAHQPLSSSIYLDRAAEADEVLSRAVYRIVQESLTNARKHAPGMRVRLTVEGGPDTGIAITCSNRLPSEAASSGSMGRDDAAATSSLAAGTLAAGDPIRGGSGLGGMARRAEICGGTFRAGVDGGEFVVTAHLPWRSAVPPQGGR